MYHITVEAGCNTLKDMRRNFAFHAEERLKGNNEPCYHCKEIARKLGML
jgi:hypothetical protein|tara:strand:- start:2014 stop:2160 length:147 start_codon:yes stop_codon:yes gene_type:complete